MSDEQPPEAPTDPSGDDGDGTPPSAADIGHPHTASDHSGTIAPDLAEPGTASPPVPSAAAVRADADTPPEAPRTSSPWPIIGWLLFLAAVVVVAVAAFAGLLMPAILLDVVSFWPAWVLAVLIALALWPLRRRGIARISAVLPLLLFTWLAASVGLHLMEWERLPSASADVEGPPADGVTTAELSIEMDGVLRLRAGGSHLYEVSLLRTGGAVGPPDALERVLPSTAGIELQERDAAGWFRSSGWSVTVDRGPAWDLSVTAPEINISTRGLDLRSLEVVGTGTVVLGPAAVESRIRIDGDVTLTVPAGAAIEVIGTARVPAGWSDTETGVTSGGSGALVTVIVAEGAIAQVVEG